MRGAKKLDAKKTMDAAEIASQMRESGLSDIFCAELLRLAPVYNSIFRMMTFWTDADKKEREEIVADLQEMIDDSKQRFEERPALKQRDVEKVARTIREFKDRLTVIINERGGVTEIAKQIGMPQSSLSRLLNSASMPRRITLLKIAKVLGLSEAEIATEFMR